MMDQQQANAASPTHRPSVLHKHGITPEDSRKRRELHSVSIRKASREERVIKRRHSSMTSQQDQFPEPFNTTLPCTSVPCRPEVFLKFWSLVSRLRLFLCLPLFLPKYCPLTLPSNLQLYKMFVYSYQLVRNTLQLFSTKFHRRFATYS